MKPDPLDPLDPLDLLSCMAEAEAIRKWACEVFAGPFNAARDFEAEIACWKANFARYQRRERDYEAD